MQEQIHFGICGRSTNSKPPGSMGKVCFQVTYWWTEYWGLWNLAKAQGLEHYDVPIQIWLKYENTSRNLSIYDMCWVMEQASAHCPCLGHGHGTQKPLVSSSTYNLRQTPNYVPIWFSCILFNFSSISNWLSWKKPTAHNPSKPLYHGPVMWLEDACLKLTRTHLACLLACWNCWVHTIRNTVRNTTPDFMACILSNMALHAGRAEPKLTLASSAKSCLFHWWMMSIAAHDLCIVQ